jgi:NAD(P)-dependent dehydrogenase (short-subunit alcohol dehydrogenase family)
MSELAGKTAWVTGSAKGIGRALALALARRGCHVAVHYRRSREQAERVASLVEKAGAEVLLLHGDLTSPADVRRNVATLKKKWKHVDILINNAGDYLRRPIERMTPETFHRYCRGCLEPAVNTSLLVVPMMRRRRWGRIVNLGYIFADRLVGNPNVAAYHTGKTALLAFTYSLARRAAQWGITVNMVSPGMNENTVDRPPNPQDVVPAGRLSRYADLENAVIFLLRDESEFITGTHMKVSGGLWV